MALPTSLRLLSALVLCLASLSLITGSSNSQSQDVDSSLLQQEDSAPLSRLSLAHVLRARRSASSLQAPPHVYASRLSGFLRPSPSKRDDGYWIWMPAHGYMSVPRDEVASSSGDTDSVGSLLRYGKK